MQPARRLDQWRHGAHFDGRPAAVHGRRHEPVVARQAEELRAARDAGGPAYTSRMQLVEVDRRLRAFFERHQAGIAAVYLFGSVPRATAGARSDVDVGVLFEDDPPRAFEALPVDLVSALERELGRSVDLVILNHAPADLAHRVLRDGRIVLDRNRSRRIQFEVRSRNEFFDLAPVRAGYRKPARHTEAP